MAFRSQRTPMGAAFPEKPLRLRMGSCHPGKFFWRAANLSNKKGISFWAKGDGQRYRVMISAGSFQAIPATVTFVAGPHWQQHIFTLEQFGLSELGCLDVRFVAFVAGPQPGSFAFNIDHVALFS